jgi:hypothetical protein
MIGTAQHWSARQRIRLDSERRPFVTTTTLRIDASRTISLPMSMGFLDASTDDSNRG